MTFLVVCFGHNDPKIDVDYLLPSTCVSFPLSVGSNCCGLAFFALHFSHPHLVLCDRFYSGGEWDVCRPFQE